MLFIDILLIIVLISLLIGSFTDFKTREVPDWVNFGLIFTGISLRLIYSMLESNFFILLEGIAGLIICVILAYLMFYAGQWGGGDAKMLMGLGALIGIPFDFSKLPFIANFLTNVVAFGAVFGMLWSIFLAIKHRKKFAEEFRKKYKANIKIRKYVNVSSLLVLILALILRDIYLGIVLISLAFISLLTLYSWLFVKAVEKSCMYKLVNPEQLTEGDWIVKDIKIKGKYIAGPKDLGIEMKQIKKLIKLKKQKKINKILIKEGIPFVPSFLIAFVITYFFGNVFYWFI